MSYSRSFFGYRGALIVVTVTLFAATAHGQPLPAVPGDSPAQGPIARLVKTPEGSPGLPPFALADQVGTIQRYVEPVPGIDLEPYVDQIVSVRHDTGQTLLASQLELPPKPFYPMIGDAREATMANGRASGSAGGELQSDGFVQQAQYADSDDTTVELLDEGEAIPESSGPVFQGPFPDGAVYPDGGYPGYSNAMPQQMAPMGMDPSYCDPMYGCPQSYGGYPPGYGMYPYPQGGGYHEVAGPPQAMGFIQPFAQPPREQVHFYADMEINFFRAHVIEEQIGKLSEKYDFSPRFVAGFYGLGPVNGRARYWMYDHKTETTNDDDSFRLEFDVIDLEATHYFAGHRTEVVLGAGLRLARIELTDDDEDDAGCDLIGLTFAADGHTPIVSFEGGRFGLVYGGRLSILGGDWSGESDDWLDHRIRDDNVVVHELHAGIECARCYRKVDLHARLVFEMQNWHSDVLSESTDTDSIGFVGPGVHIGAEF
jgi:hypothetical protein